MLCKKLTVLALVLAVRLDKGASVQFFPFPGSDLTPCSAKDPNINQCFLEAANTWLPSLMTAGSDLTPCSAKDPNINYCVLEAANKLLPSLVTGIWQIDAIPLDPLEVTLLRVDKGNDFIPTLGFNYTNNQHLGWKDATITAASVDPKNYRFSFTVNIPLYQLLGPYEISGTIISIPLEGHGNIDHKIYDYVFHATVEGEPVTMNGETHLRIKNFKQQSTGGDVHLQFDNLFGDEEISAYLNALVNLNIEEILIRGFPLFDHLMEQVHTGILQRIFNRVPYSSMFTDLD